MKPRVKIDSFLVGAAIVLTFMMFLSPGLYPGNISFDNWMDFLGILIILEGNMLRMAARGHKKVHSDQSTALVTTGPYAIVRNPMYLGTFFIGIGFVLILWPVWFVPLFAGLFYSRFKIQIEKEERFWQESLKDEYEDYCQHVPRLRPSLENLAAMDLKELMNTEEMFSTKEKWGLLTWPFFALILELSQQRFVFGSARFWETLAVFLIAMVVYAMSFFVIHNTVKDIDV